MRFPRTTAAAAIVGVAICSILLASADSVLAQSSASYRLAADRLDAKVYAASIGISTLVKVEVLPAKGIDIESVTTSGFLESFALVDDGDAEFAVLKTIWSNMAPSSDDVQAETVGHHVRSIAALWTDGPQSVQLVARSDVDEITVYEITKAIFEQLPFLQGVEESFGSTSLDRALGDSHLPRHPGAQRYFEEVALLGPARTEPETKRTPPATSVQDAKTFPIFFGFDQATLTSEGLATVDEIKSFTEQLDTPTVWIAGYTDSMGSSDYNLTLAQKRADAVLQALKGLDLNVRTIDVSAFGERAPFVVTSDEIHEKRNRRVEVLVEPLPGPVAIRKRKEPAEGPDRQPDQDPEGGILRPTF